MKTYLTGINARSSEIDFGRPKRQVFLRRTSYNKPVQTEVDFLTERDTEAVRDSNKLSDQIHGLAITHDQAIDSDMLGTREELHRALERKYDDRPAAQQILDRRVTEKLKQIVAREASVDLQQRNWIIRHWRKAVGGVRNAVSKVLGEDASDVGSKFNDRYDRRNIFSRVYRSIFARPVSVIEIAGNLARDILTPLSNVQRNAIQTQLTALGVPFVLGPNLLQSQINQLAAANPQQLDMVRRRVGIAALGTRNAAPLRPARERRTRLTAYDRLIQMHEVRLAELTDQTSTHAFDTQRQGQFNEMLRSAHPQIYEIVNEQILVPDALWQLNKSAKELLWKLEERLEIDGPALLLSKLERVRDSLPNAKDEKPAGTEKSDQEKQKEEINTLTESIKKQFADLRKAYTEAQAAGQNLFSVKAQAMTPGLAKQTEKSLQEAVVNSQSQVTKFAAAINSAEGELKSSIAELQQSLQDISSTVTVPANLNTLFTNFPSTLAISNYQQLFGDTNPTSHTATYAAFTGAAPFKTNVNNFTNRNYKQIQDEIKKTYFTAQQKKMRINPGTLLLLLNMREYQDSGIYIPKQRLAMAYQDVLETADRIANVELERAINNRNLERLAETHFDSITLARIRKAILTLAGSNKNVSAKRILKQLTTTDAIDEGNSLGVFAGIRPDFTQSEFRQYISAHGGISDKKLVEFSEKLKAVVISFEILKGEKKIKVWDKDAMMLRSLIKVIQSVKNEMRTREFVNQLQGKTGERNEILIEKFQADEQAKIATDDEILSSVNSESAEWKLLMDKEKFKKKMLDKYREARKTLKEKESKGEGLTKAEVKHYLGQRGLLAADDKWATKERLREDWQETKEDFKKGYEKTKGATSRAWKATSESKITKGIGKGAKAVGSGAKKVGEVMLYRPAKAVFYDAPKAVLGAVLFPFKVAGGVIKGLGDTMKSKETKEKEKKEAAKKAEEKAAAEKVKNEGKKQELK